MGMAVVWPWKLLFQAKALFCGKAFPPRSRARGFRKMCHVEAAPSGELRGVLVRVWGVFLTATKPFIWLGRLRWVPVEGGSVPAAAAASLPARGIFSEGTTCQMSLRWTFAGFRTSERSTGLCWC